MRVGLKNLVRRNVIALKWKKLGHCLKYSANQLLHEIIDTGKTKSKINKK